MSTEINNIIKNIHNPETNIDIIGNLYICDELCNLSFNYKDNEDINNLTIKHDKNSIVLEIKYNGKSSINYNGGERFGSKEIQFNLKKIVLISPAKHFIKSYRNKMELILIHQSKDGKTFQNISILLDVSDDVENQKKIQYQLFKDIAENIPTKAVSNKKINTKYTWSAEDLLPDNRSFYTYNSPHDPKVNWVIFSNNVYVPSLLLDNYLKYVSGPIKNAKGEVAEKAEKFINASIPINPKNLVLFSHQIIKGIPASCAKKLANEIKNKDAPIFSETTTNKSETEKEKSKESEKSTEKSTEKSKKDEKVESDIKTTDKNTIEDNKEDKDENKDDDEVEKEKTTETPWYRRWWAIVLWIILGYFIVSGIVFYLFKGMITNQTVQEGDGNGDILRILLKYFTLPWSYIDRKIISRQKPSENIELNEMEQPGQSVGPVGQPGQTVGPVGQTVGQPGQPDHLQQGKPNIEKSVSVHNNTKAKAKANSAKANFAAKIVAELAGNKL